VFTPYRYSAGSGAEGDRGGVRDGEGEDSLVRYRAKWRQKKGKKKWCDGKRL